MAKEIDKIIQSKTAPKSNNVLWDDGENLKINRNGKWESTGSGTSVPQEVLDTIDFGYYTFASGNIVANWGPFTIKEGETIKVDTNTWAEPEYIKIHDYSGVGYTEKGTIFGLNKRPDGTLGVIGINIKLQGTTLEIYNNSNLGTVTISFLAYKKQVISNTTHSISSDLLSDLELRSDIEIIPGEHPYEFWKLIGKNVNIFDRHNFISYGGFCINVKEGFHDNYNVVFTINLVDFPDVKVIKVYLDNNYLVQSVSSEDKKITVV